jgi:AcrR family transcriptional regulator
VRHIPARSINVEYRCVSTQCEDQRLERSTVHRAKPEGPAPGSGGKRAQNKLQNRQAILTAAREVFAEVGYEAASVRDIIGRTGLASGTFYNYYRSKEEIARAIASDAAMRLRPILRAHREQATDFADYLIGAVRIYFEFIVDEQMALRTTRPLAERHPRVRVQTPATTAVFEEVRSSIALVMQRDPALRVDVEYLTAAVIGVAREIGERMLARPLDIERAATFAANLILRGLPAVPRIEL